MATFGRHCQNLTIPITISSHQPLFSPPLFTTNLDATSFAQSFLQRGRILAAELTIGNQTLQSTYNISAAFCHPLSGISDAPLQILTHGVGFDKVYWDLPYNAYNYSWVSNAVEKYGFNTLAIDRLGIGASSHGNPVNEIQAYAEVEALRQVTLAARAGTVPGIAKPGGFKKVVHVGHSFGSILSYWLSALDPNVTDGLVLTGFSRDTGSAAGIFFAGWDIKLASLNQPFRFGSHTRGRGVDGDFLPLLKNYVKSLGSNPSFTSQELWNDIATTEMRNLIVGLNDTSVTPQDLPGGYLTWADFTANQFLFLLPGHYDVGLGLYTETIKQPITVGELLTIGAPPDSSNFAGPVLVLTGDKDLAACGGDCYATGGAGGAGGNIPAQSVKAFPKARPFKAYIQPRTAHGLNAHYNASAAYDIAHTWLGTHGLGGKA
ncbi:hypothetical protein GQ43DRAFT_441343 [Delitschia confertaspora ATCC 74209]|uniref:AB hydrolase-1 domain-containing protein n=1 Tax=Delitschia confertaspora ATCC 74209 TaxID=1513339 RepID=A0A9P4MY90_9PLEO|nr:hypothetical protein GQ43DRAFT_441343 [Delitschia confertaspora ATCC 74209]